MISDPRTEPGITCLGCKCVGIMTATYNRMAQGATPLFRDPECPDVNCKCHVKNQPFRATIEMF